MVKLSNTVTQRLFEMLFERVEAAENTAEFESNCRQSAEESADRAYARAEDLRDMLDCANARINEFEYQNRQRLLQEQPAIATLQELKAVMIPNKVSLKYNKIERIKTVRVITRCTLKEAKDFVESFDGASWIQSVESDPNA